MSSVVCGSSQVPQSDVKLKAKGKKLLRLCCLCCSKRISTDMTDEEPTWCQINAGSSKCIYCQRKKSKFIKVSL